MACSGRLEGAAYRLVLPRAWNGTLLIYNHGYRFPRPVPPAFSPVSHAAMDRPTRAFATRLADQGYAVAASSYGANGWATREAVRADERLHAFFARAVGRPQRTYVAGDSLGGLVTVLLAEKHPRWVSGALPACGVLGGTNLNLDLALDLAYAVQRLIDPSLRLTGYPSAAAAQRAWRGAYGAILRIARDPLARGPRLLIAAAVVDASSRTRRFDGHTPESLAKAYGESVLTGLAYGTFGRFDIEQRVGGNPSTNVGVDYAARVSRQERQLPELLSGGSVGRGLRALASGRRTSPDAAARRRADALGDPSGDVRVPTLTLHTTADPLVLVANESVYARRARAHGAADHLLQLFVAPPSRWNETQGAPYGAGHCNFTAAQRLTALQLLDTWVRTGTRPSTAAVTRAFTGVPGLAPDYHPPPWPAEQADG